jgi:hypothetical protein
LVSVGKTKIDDYFSPNLPNSAGPSAVSHFASHSAWSNGGTAEFCQQHYFQVVL